MIIEPITQRSSNIIYDFLPNSRRRQILPLSTNFLPVYLFSKTLMPLAAVAGSAINHIPGDLNGDSWVDEEDLQIFGSEWLSSATSSIANLDSAHSSIPGSASSVVSVDFEDYSVMAKNWKNRCSADNCVPPILGDFNRDGKVDKQDLEIFSSNWLSSGISNIANLDNTYTQIPGSASSVVSVDFHDYSIMAKNWSPGCSACSAVSHLNLGGSARQQFATSIRMRFNKYLRKQLGLT